MNSPQYLPVRSLAFYVLNVSLLGGHAEIARLHFFHQRHRHTRLPPLGRRALKFHTRHSPHGNGHIVQSSLRFRIPRNRLADLRLGQ